MTNFQLSLSEIKEFISELPKYNKQYIKDSLLILSLYLKDSLHIIFDDIYAERNLNKKLSQINSILNIFQFWGPHRKFSYCFISHKDAKKIGIDFKRNDLTIKIDSYLRIIERHPFPKGDSIEIGAFSILIPLLIELDMIILGKKDEIIINLPKFKDKNEEEEYNKKMFLTKINFQIDLLKDAFRNEKVLILNNYAFKGRNFEFEAFKTIEKRSFIIEGIPRSGSSKTSFHFLYEVDITQVRSLFRGALIASEDLEEMPLLIFNDGDLGPSDLGQDFLELHLLIPQKTNKYPIESIGNLLRNFLLRSDWSTINDLIDEKEFRLEWKIFRQKKEPKTDTIKNSEKISSGFSELDKVINKRLSDLNFWTINETRSDNMLLWIEMIKTFFKIIHKCYDYNNFFRHKAQKWRDEVRDMNPWMGGVLKDYFQDKHKDHSSVAGGDADHWINQIPIEDKLLRSEENLDNDTIIDEKYEKHKNQILKEAGPSGYGFLVIADIRKEIKNGSIIPLPLKESIKIYYENKIWVIVILIQAFSTTPSQS